MTFSPFLKAVLVSAMVISAPTLSADLSQTKQQVQRFSKALNHSYHGKIAIENFKVDAVKHQFVFGHGIVLTISTNIDELRRQQVTSQQQQIKKQPQLVLRNEKLEDKDSKQSLNKLRFQARNIAHQEFSLQKQIDSMQAQSLESKNEQQKDAIDKKIRTNQDKLKGILTEKMQVSRAIANYSDAVEQSSTKTVHVFRNTIYNKLVKQSYQMLCNDLALIEQLANNEQLTLVFEGLGEAEAKDHKAKVVNVDKAILIQCNNGELSVDEALKHSYSYQY